MLRHLILVGITSLAFAHQSRAQEDLMAQVEATERATHRWKTDPQNREALAEALASLIETIELGPPESVESLLCQRLLLVAQEFFYATWAWWEEHEDELDLLNEWVPSILVQSTTSPAATRFLIEYSFEWAQFLGTKGDFERAWDFIDDAIERLGKEPRFLCLRIDLAKHLQEWDVAFEGLDEAWAAMELREGHPQYLEDALQVRWTESMLAMRVGLIERAERSLRWILSHDPSSLSQAGRYAHILARLSFIDLCLLTANVVEGERACQALSTTAIPPELRAPFLVREAVVLALRGLRDDDRSDEIHRLRSIREELSDYHLSWRVDLALSRLALRDEDFEEARERLERVDQQVERLEGVREFTQRDRAFVASGWAEWVLVSGNQEKREGVGRRLFASFDSLLKGWDKTPLLPGGLGFFEEYPHRSIVNTTIDWNANLVDAEAGLRSFMRAQSVGTLARRHKLAVPTIEDLRDTLLKDGEGILAYHNSLEGTSLFLVDGSSVEYYRLRDEVSGLPETDVGLISILGELDLLVAEKAERSEDWKALAMELTDRLLPESVLTKVLGWRHLFVVGDVRVLGGLNKCLLSEQLPLDAVVPTSYLPSIPYAYHLARNRDLREDGGVSLVVGPGESEDPNEAFVFGEEEERQLLRGYSRDRVDVIQSENSSDPTAVVSGIREARVLHLIGHGVFEYSKDRISGVTVGRDRVLWANDLEKSCDADVVILSVCGAARGHSREGEDGVSHLGGAALEGGASAVILSGEDLPYGPHLHLIAHVHEFLAQGLSAAQSLCLAKRRLMADPRFEDPRYWSNVFVFGLGHRGRKLEGPLAQFDVRKEGDSRFSGETKEEGGGDSSLLLIMGGAALVLLGVGVQIGMRRR